MFDTAAVFVGGTLVDGLSEPPSKVMMTAPAEATATTMQIAAAAASVRGLPIGGRGLADVVASLPTVASRAAETAITGATIAGGCTSETKTVGAAVAGGCTSETKTAGAAVAGGPTSETNPESEVDTRGGVAGSLRRFGSGKDDKSVGTSSEGHLHTCLCRIENRSYFYAAVARCQADLMLSFAANISVLFTEFDSLERFAQASKAGFVAVEIQFPYQYNAGILAEQLVRHQLAQVLL